MALYLIQKRLGKTPLEEIESIRKSKKISPKVKMTYAGRLDPAAEGLLVILSEEDVHKKDEYTSLDKTYEVDILFGLKTDTGDILGVPKEKKAVKIDKKELKKILSTLTGKRLQKYHPYSSKHVDGQPLWKITRQNKNTTIPEHYIEIKKIEILKETSASLKFLQTRVKKICSILSGDFRQKKILNSWDKIKNQKYQVFRLGIKCSSGTYMRVLAEEIGEALKENCVCIKILRTRIGKFT